MSNTRLFRWYMAFFLYIPVYSFAQDGQPNTPGRLSWEERVVECGGQRPHHDALTAMAILASDKDLKTSEICQISASVAVAIQLSRAQAVPHFRKLLIEHSQARENWEDSFIYLMSDDLAELNHLSRDVPDFSARASYHLGRHGASSEKAHAFYCRWLIEQSAQQAIMRHCWPGNWITHFNPEPRACAALRGILYSAVSIRIDITDLFHDAFSPNSCADSRPSKYHAIASVYGGRSESLRWLYQRARRSSEHRTWFETFPADEALIYWVNSDCDSLITIPRIKLLSLCSNAANEHGCARAIICAKYLRNERLSSALMETQNRMEKSVGLSQPALRYVPGSSYKAPLKRIALLWLYQQIWAIRLLK